MRERISEIVQSSASIEEKEICQLAFVSFVIVSKLILEFFFVMIVPGKNNNVLGSSSFRQQESKVKIVLRNNCSI